MMRSMGTAAAMAAALMFGSNVQARERTPLATDVPGELVQGRAFVPLRAAGEALGAQVEWDAAARQVTLTRGDHLARLTVGKKVGTIVHKLVPLDAAPFMRQGRVMVPIRFAAQALDVPVSYDHPHKTVLIGPAGKGTLWALPLEIALEPGIVIHTPQAGAAVKSRVRVNGQANVFEGSVVVEVRDSRGRVLGEKVGTGAMGSWGVWTVEVPYEAPARGREQGRIVVYANSPKDGSVQYRADVPVVLK